MSKKPKQTFSWMNPKLEARPAMKNITNSRDCLKCRGCCYFLNKKETKLAPYFSKREMLGVEKYMVKKNGFFQAKIAKAKKINNAYNCVFLNEKNYKCKIYKKRPIDCILWPFVVGWDKEKKDVYIWSVNNKWCPAVDENKVRSQKTINGIIKYLKKVGYFKEIIKNERPLWSYKSYQIKLKKITNLLT